MANSQAGICVVGLISGTSIDGIDVAAARLRARAGVLELEPLGCLESPYPPRLRADLLDALPPNPCTAGKLTELDTAVGQAFAAAAAAGVEQLAGDAAHLISSLGQTVYHWVEHGTAHGTLQLGQPAWIAEHTGLPVVADFRARDIAAGGHGAPLASTLDVPWLRDLAEATERPAAALNIGGIANVTVVSEQAHPLGYDTGPGNALLDLAATQVTGGAQRSDTDGALAEDGTVRADLLERLLADDYYRAQPPKSTGKEHFHSAYLAEALAGLPSVRDQDLLATLTELTATTIADALARHAVGTVVASGGGVHNAALMRALASQLAATGNPATLMTSDALGLPSSAKEGYLAGLLGWLTWHGCPANVPSGTGASGGRLLGSITPGATALQPPPPLPEAVTRLRVAGFDHDRLGVMHERS